MKILVTRAAGFIGFHTCKKILDLAHTVYGFDNVNNYYNTILKYDRFQELDLLRKNSSRILNLMNLNEKFINKTIK